MTEQRDLFGDVVIADVLLRDKFLEPPFTILDSKGGDWQARKRLWKSKGIRSEVSREGVSVYKSFDAKKYGRPEMSEVSIFDPSLCELMYRWFCPEGGTILDPFSGGSVRGIVANYLGFKYTGIDIRPEQIESNYEQARAICPNNLPNWITGDSNIVLDSFLEHKAQPYITPLYQLPGMDIWVKRDDLFKIAGVNGGKVRSCFHLMQGTKGVTTAGSRKSPQINIVASIANKMGIPFVAHCPEGELGDELELAKAKGAIIIQHKAGYNSVIKARARDYAEDKGFTLIPFGMECDEAVTQTKTQVLDIPDGVKRIVIPVGSGMSLCGLLNGLKEKDIKIPVLGVVVGADPEGILDEYAPEDWRSMATLVKSGMDYHEEVKDNVFNGIKLDPIYEAKCIPFIQDGDLFWIIGLREAVALTSEEHVSQANIVVDELKEKEQKFDFIFSCPPYADLEVYSDLEGDISNKEYPQFIELYRSIIKKAGSKVKDGGFACFVVSDIRDKKGYYRDFTGDTKKAFFDAGFKLYNSMILLQPLGTAMLRAAKIFESGKKITKVHEEVLLFKKVK